MAVDRGLGRLRIGVVDSFLGSGSVVESLRVEMSRMTLRGANLSSVRTKFNEYVVAKHLLGLHRNSLPTVISRDMVCVHLMLHGSCSERDIFA
ncbi:hypothetical protein OROGR_002381 [Orobanche gracilis]